MGFLTDIQNDLVDSGKPIGPTLLKIRLLSAKLGDAKLEEWVIHESEGYPQEHPLPDYRKLRMAFIGHFSGPLGSGLRDATIPSAVIRQHAGREWERLNLRDSAASIDNICQKEDGMHLDLSNLGLLIDGKVFPNYHCIQLKGYVSQASVVEASNAIRNRMIGLTIELEKRIPGIASLELSGFKENKKVANQVYNTTYHGTVTQISNSGDNNTFSFEIKSLNQESLIDNLSKAGLSDEDAQELGGLIASEKGDDPEKPLGKKALAWLGNKVSNGLDLGIKGGVGALVNLANEAALQYYGLK